MEAIQRSRHVALRFSTADARFAFAVYEDGNGNGVLSADIQRGVDRVIRGPERLSDNFRNVELGTRPALPPIEPRRFGTRRRSDQTGRRQLCQFQSAWRCDVRNHLSHRPGQAQYAVRVFGATGKIRIYRFNWRSAKWISL